MLQRGSCKPALTHSFRKGQAGSNPLSPKNTRLSRRNSPPQLSGWASIKGGSGRTAGAEGGPRLRGEAVPDPPLNRRG